MPSLPLVKARMAHFAATQEWERIHRGNGDYYWRPKRSVNDVIRVRGWRDPVTLQRFAAAVAPNTTTGWYRQTAMRLNNTALCNHVRSDAEKQQFRERMAACQDDAASYKWDWVREGNQAVRVCVPTNTRTSPWGDSSVDAWTADKKRGDVYEEAYIDMEPLDRDEEFYYYESVLERKLWCTSDTTLGWFELGNEPNGLRPGPILNEAPTLETAEEQGFLEVRHDVKDPRFSMSPPPEIDRDHSLSPGPLGIWIRSVFDTGSVLDALRNYTYNDVNVNSTWLFNETAQPQLDACRDFRDRLMPGLKTLWFADPCVHFYNPPGHLGPAIYTIRPGWQSTLVVTLLGTLSYGTQIFSENLFEASQALLDTAADWKEMEGPFAIWSTMEHQTSRYRLPHVSSQAALAVISVLVGLQVVAVLGLVAYVLWHPVWTETLDAMAVARLANRIRDKDGGYIEALGLRWIGVQERDLKRSSLIREVDALVGVVDTPPDGVPLATLSANSSRGRGSPARHNGRGTAGVAVTTTRHLPSAAAVVPSGGGGGGDLEPDSDPVGEPPAYTPREQEEQQRQDRVPTPSAFAAMARSAVRVGGNGLPPYVDSRRSAAYNSVLDLGGPGVVRRGVGLKRVGEV